MATFTTHAVAASTSHFGRMVIARGQMELASSGSGTDSAKLSVVQVRPAKSFSEWDQVFGSGAVPEQLPTNDIG